MLVKHYSIVEAFVHTEVPHSATPPTSEIENAHSIGVREIHPVSAMDVYIIMNGERVPDAAGVSLQDVPVVV
jgi:hypothetical protein